MRCVVYTETNFLELGISAKDAFLKCLPPDEDGKFDTVNTMSDEVMSNINKLTDDDLGMAWQKEFSYVEKLKKVMAKVINGKKFMVTDDWQGKEYLMTAVEKMNEGMTISQVNKWIKEENQRLREIKRKETIEYAGIVNDE